MHSMKQRTRPPAAVGYPRTRIRAMRTDDIHAQLERRLIALGLSGMQEATALRRPIARALRAERRAVRSGGGYDPLRHLVLVRLDRLLRRQRRNCR